MRRWVAATSAFTVRSPSVGGQSMTMCGYSRRMGAILSFSRKCASISPTSLASSLASAMREGAIHRFSTVDGRITSASAQSGSATASYTLLVTCAMSRNDIVLLAWGSRSMSSVRFPRSASAAARLMAVVVLPTPPFWLAMATIIRGEARGDCSRLHLVLAEIVGIEALQPLLQPIGVRRLRHEIDRLGVVDDRLLHENRRPRPQRQRNRVARPRVDGHRLAVQPQVDERVERVLLQVADDHLLHRRLEVLDDVAQEIMRHRPRRRDVLDLQRDRVGLENPDPDRQDFLPLLIAQDDNRHVRDGIDHQPLDAHLDLHKRPTYAPAAALSSTSATADTAATASPHTLCGPARPTRTRTVRPI